MSIERIALSGLPILGQNKSAWLSVLGHIASQKASEKKGGKGEPYLDSQC